MLTVGEKYKDLIRTAPSMSGITMSSLNSFKAKYKLVHPAEVEVVYHICQLVILVLEGIPWPENNKWLGIQVADDE